MKSKIITAVLLCGLIAGFSLDLSAQVGKPHRSKGRGYYLCAYDEDNAYMNWQGIFCSDYGGNMEFVKFCYEDATSRGYVIDKDYVDAIGYPTVSAAICNRVEGLKFFLDKGFYLDESNKESRFTPLQGAARFGAYDTAKYLLEKGADPTKKTYEPQPMGFGPYKFLDSYELALKSEDPRVIALLKEAWMKWKGLSEIKRERLIKEIKSLNMNDYEKFKLEHNLGNFKVEAFFS